MITLDKSLNESTGAGLSFLRTAPAYAATLALSPKGYKNVYNVAQLTGAMTINLTVTGSNAGDEIVFTFSEDATGRTVTLGTGLKGSVATLVVASGKFATASFVFDGTNFIETGRAITA